MKSDIAHPATSDIEVPNNNYDKCGAQVPNIGFAANRTNSAQFEAHDIPMTRGTDTPETSAHTIPPLALPTGNLQLALNYLTSGLLGLLGSQKHNADVRFHGYHALFTTLCFLALHAILGILGGTFLLLQSLTDLAGGGFSLFQVFRAYQNRPIAVPIISTMARKQAEPSAPAIDQTLR